MKGSHEVHATSYRRTVWAAFPLLCAALGLLLPAAGCNNRPASASFVAPSEQANPLDTQAWEKRLARARKLFSQGKYKAAKEEFETVIAAEPSRPLKARAKFGRADCNFALGKYHLASRQYNVLEQFYRDVDELPRDEVLYKLGLACKRAGAIDLADYWFSRVFELYAKGKFAARARREHSRLGVAARGKEIPYTIEAASFSKREKAEACAAKLDAAGYKHVQIVPVTVMGNRYYDVHVGSYASRIEAAQAQNAMILAGYSAAVRPATIKVFK